MEYQNNVRECLINQFNISFELLKYHVKNLTIEECLWQPSVKGIYLDYRGNDIWNGTIPGNEDYAGGPPNIAWLTWHIDFWWSMVINYSFGDATLSTDDVLWHPSTEKIVNRFETLKADWLTIISDLSNEDFNSTKHTKWPFFNRSFYDVVAWLNLELIKNASEIGYVRFLYGSRDLK